MNNMDDFFKKRLSDFEESDDGWNIPSDDIWENSKEMLPKPKKKKRKFIFFLFGTAILAISLLFYYPNILKKVDHKILAEHKSPKTEVMEENMRHQSTDHIEQSEGGQKEVLSVPTNNIEEADSKSKRYANIKNGSLESHEQVVNKISEYNQVSRKSEQGKSTKNQSRSAKSKNSYSGAPSIVIEDAYQNKNNRAFITNEAPLNQSIDNSKSPIESIINNSSKQLIESLPFLDLLKIRRKEIISPFNITTVQNPLDFSRFIPLKHIFAAQKEVKRIDEIGISHAFSAFSFIDQLTEIDNQNEFFMFPKYKNINFHYNTSINNRWRFSTGVFLSKIDLHIDFHEFFEYQSDLMTETITNEYGEVLNQSSANESGTVEVSFIDGKEPIEGEILNIKGEVDINLKALQIPLFLTSHWFKNKSEFYVGGGPTLELLGEGQKNGEIGVFRGTDPIHLTADILDLQESYVDFSLYATTGFKYHLSNQINLGLNLKINLSEPIFSTADLGIFYRW